MLEEKIIDIGTRQLVNGMYKTLAMKIKPAVNEAYKKMSEEVRPLVDKVYKQVIMDKTAF